MATVTETRRKSDTARKAFDRRELLIGVSVATAAGALLGTNIKSMAATDNGWKAQLQKILGNATPAEGKITLEIPEIAENGNTVPFAVSVDSPMTDDNHVKAVHVLSTQNPQALVATFHFTPESGKAAVSSRMRLAETQDVVSVAELSDGTFTMVKRLVKVTIGGCG